MATEQDFLNDLTSDDTTLDAAKILKRLNAAAHFQTRVANRLQKLSDKLTPSPPQIMPEALTALTAIATDAARTVTLVAGLNQLLGGTQGGPIVPPPG